MTTGLFAETDLATVAADLGTVEEAIFLQGKLAAEEKLRFFVEQSWHVVELATTFLPGIHVDAICDHLQAVAEDRIKGPGRQRPAGACEVATVLRVLAGLGMDQAPREALALCILKADLAIEIGQMSGPDPVGLYRHRCGDPGKPSNASRQWLP